MTSSTKTLTQHANRKELRQVVRDCNLANRMDFLVPIAEFFGLEYYLKEFNTAMAEHHTVSDGDERYHGTLHSYVTFLNCYEGAVHEGLVTTCYGRVRVLLLAALYHDFLHTHGKSDDDTNIQAAIKGLRFIHEHAPVKQAMATTEFVEVLELIRCTRYPYLVPTENVWQQLIRDADMMGTYLTQTAQKHELFIGLWRELNVAAAVHDRTPQSWEQFQDGQKKFSQYQANHWNTRWARNKHARVGWYACTTHLLHVLSLVTPEQLRARSLRTP